MNAMETLRAGEILHAPWGYDMTHPDFYLVLKGAEVGKFCEVVKVKRDERATGYLTGTATPSIPLVPVGKPEKRKVKAGKVVKFASYKVGTVWNGEPKYFNYCD